MEDENLDVSADTSWDEKISQALDKQRHHVHQYLATQRERFERIEEKLADQIDQIAKQVSLAQAQTTGAVDETQRKAEQLKRRAAELDEQDAQLVCLQKQLDLRQTEMDDLASQNQIDLGARHEEVEQTTIQLHSRARQLDQRKDQLSEQQAQLDQERHAFQDEQQSLQETEKALDGDQQELVQQTANLDGQRQQLLLQSSELDDQRQQLQKEKTELDGRRQDFEQQCASLDEQRGTFQIRCEELETERKEHAMIVDNFQQLLAQLDTRELLVQKRESTLEIQTAELKEARAVAEKSRQEHLTANEALQRDHQQLQMEKDHLVMAQEQLTQRKMETSQQRQSISEQLRAQRDRDTAELDKRRAELKRLAASEDERGKQQLIEVKTDRDNIQNQLSKLQKTCDSLVVERDELATRLCQHTEAMDAASARVVQVENERDEAQAEMESQVTAVQLALSQARHDYDDRSAQLTQYHNQITEQTTEIDQLRTQLTQISDPQEHQENGDTSSAELEELRSQNDVLREKLASVERQQRDDLVQEEERNKLQRQMELVIEDGKEMKAENTRLQEQLDAAPRQQSIAGDVPVGRWDWESQKKRLMEQLKDMDEEDLEEFQDKLSVEEVVRETDRIVAEKDREIAELCRKLAEPKETPGTEALGATTIAELLNQDELIRHERENLKQVQEEWRGKLRQAEIDLSVERAKIGRERTELEEKLRVFERDCEEHDSQQDDRSRQKTSNQPPRRRWLTKLGLNGSDED